jgi:hypothetical protein
LVNSVLPGGLRAAPPLVEAIGCFRQLALPPFMKRAGQGRRRRCRFVASPGHVLRKHPASLPLAAMKVHRRLSRAAAKSKQMPAIRLAT